MVSCTGNIGKEIEGMLSDMRGIEDNATGDAASIEEIAATADHLKNMVEELNEKLGHFKV